MKKNKPRKRLTTARAIAAEKNSSRRVLLALYGNPPPRHNLTMYAVELHRELSRSKGARLERAEFLKSTVSGLLMQAVIGLGNPRTAAQSKAQLAELARLDEFKNRQDDPRLLLALYVHQFPAAKPTLHTLRLWTGCDDTKKVKELAREMGIATRTVIEGRPKKFSTIMREIRSRPAAKNVEAISEREVHQLLKAGKVSFVDDLKRWGK